MKDNDILNKAVKLATEGLETVNFQKENANKMTSELKKILKKESPEAYAKVKELEKVAKSGNINKILDLKRELDANKGKY